jgi:hypothetical protein
MSAELETSSKKRRREVSHHKPAKKLKHTPNLNDIDVDDSRTNEERLKNKLKRQKGEKLRVNGEKSIEHSKSKLKRKSRRVAEATEKDKSEAHVQVPIKPRIPELAKNEPSIEAIVKKSSHRSKLRTEAAPETTVIPQELVQSSEKALAEPPKPRKQWSWSTSLPLGGRFAPLDPVFSLDEK